MKLPKKIYIIGCGGVGSRILEPAYRYLATIPDRQFRLILVDGDVVEDRNLDRQSFSISDVGHSKAESLAETFMVDPPVSTKNVTLEVISEFIDKDNIVKIEDNSLIFCAVDSKETRVLLQDYLVKSCNNAILINGGNELHDGQVQLMIIREGELLTPKLTDAFPDLLEPETSHQDDCTTQAQADPQLICANMFVANLMITTLWHLHSTDEEKLDSIPGPVIFFDLKTGNMRPDDRKVYSSK